MVNTSKRNIEVKGTPEFASYYNSLSDPMLKKLIDNAKQILRNNPQAGDHIPRRLWPDEYRKKYKIDNLWLYGLSASDRLPYTLVSDGNQIYCAVLEVLPHNEYEKRFGYKKS